MHVNTGNSWDVNLSYTQPGMPCAAYDIYKTYIRPKAAGREVGYKFLQCHSLSQNPSKQLNSHGMSKPCSAQRTYRWCCLQMLIVSRLSVLIFALFAGVWSIILIKIGIDINWLFFVIGLLVASVFPSHLLPAHLERRPKGAPQLYPRTRQASSSCQRTLS